MTICVLSSQIFNGFGSWPDFLQQSSFFKGYMDIATTWYMIFQQHSLPTPELIMKDLKWNMDNKLGGFHWVSMLDPYTLVALPDLR